MKPTNRNRKSSSLSRSEEALLEFALSHQALKHQDAGLDFLYFAAVRHTHIKGTASHGFHQVLSNSMCWTSGLIYVEASRPFCSLSLSQRHFGHRRLEFCMSWTCLLTLDRERKLYLHDIVWFQISVYIVFG